MPPAAKAASAMSRTLACGLPSSAPRFSSSRILASMGSASSVAASACSMAPTGASAVAGRWQPAVSRSRVALGLIRRRATSWPS
ncbi:hypothetical protein G6F54_014483 [Rhizopus delemar]|nr:hypothetical protein G6F54_014483 [Rhizopus delemar]